MRKLWCPFNRRNLQVSEFANGTMENKTKISWKRKKKKKQFKENVVTNDQRSLAVWNRKSARFPLSPRDRNIHKGDNKTLSLSLSKKLRKTLPFSVCHRRPYVFALVFWLRLIFTILTSHNKQCVYWRLLVVRAHYHWVWNSIRLPTCVSRYSRAHAWGREIWPRSG